ncbi:XerC Integrase [Candidatus Methylopumilus universalis]|uniref:tyrosine-type recombinase/integrase n=1 Tax=Candidatus Methylopumilus universalis TaxID=2588536 RepID=UPI003BEF24F1
MATISNRNNKWHVRVRRSGQPTVAKTFLIRTDAEKWARSIEIEIDRGTYINTSFAQKTLFKDLIQQYLKEVTPTLRGAPEDTYRLRKMMRNPIAELNLTELTPNKIANYRDERLKEIKPNTVIRELAYISSMINHARREWGLGIINPVAQIRKPSQPQGRERVLNDVEMNRLLQELEKINPFLKPLCEFALETAMRRGELMSLLWVNVNFEKSVAFLPLTKNGDSRYVPLSTKAIKILKLLPRDIEGRAFPLNKSSVSVLFLRASRRAKVEDIHFHDLRHMALTRLSSRFTNILELAAISGHRELKMLQRYVHIKAEDLAKKMG